jgi:hypothetical protein
VRLVETSDKPRGTLVRRGDSGAVAAQGSWANDKGADVTFDASGVLTAHGRAAVEGHPLWLSGRRGVEELKDNSAPRGGSGFLGLWPRVK